MARNAASLLSLETWEQVFLEIDSKTEEGKADIYNSLCACKTFYAAIKGPALVEEIHISNPSRIPKLLSYLMQNPDLAKLVKHLEFDIARILQEDCSAIQLSYYLQPVVFIIQLCSSIQYLHDPPSLETTYTATKDAILRLPGLRWLSFKGDVPLNSGDGSVYKWVNLGDIHRLACEVVTLRYLVIDYYAGIAPEFL